MSSYNAYCAKEEDSVKQNCWETFAADKLAANGNTVEVITDAEQQLAGIDIICNGKLNIDVKNSITTSASLGWDLFEIHNYNNPDGTAATYKYGWFTNPKSKTDMYVQYQIYYFNGKYIIEEYSIYKKYVVNYYNRIKDKYGISDNILEKDSLVNVCLLDSVPKPKSVKVNDYLRVKHTSEEEKDNPDAQHLTFEMLTYVDSITSVVSDKFKINYYISDTNDLTKIKFADCTSFTVPNGKKLVHKYLTAEEARTGEPVGEYVAYLADI